ncbi:MAG: PTS sugar transporter subunit IIA [Phycisphaeraceae bacterium]|nr:PTS sugar transporter subunit IIA [Phycisphaeraceae bacterium]
MNILEILRPESVKVPLVSADKRGAIDELVDLLAGDNRVSDLAALKAAVWERECQRSTGIGEGLAIPHGKCAAVKDLAMVVGRPASPIPFDAIDKKPVRLLILLVSPVDKISLHIQALGRVSRLLSDPGLREATYGASDAASLYELFRKAEGG